MEFKEVLDNFSSVEDALPKLYEKLSGTLSNLAQSSLPLIDTNKGQVYVSNEKVKREPVELSDGTTYKGE